MDHRRLVQRLVERRLISWRLGRWLVKSSWDFSFRTQVRFRFRKRDGCRRCVKSVRLHCRRFGRNRLGLTFWWFDARRL
jgi:hypothetical protein